MQKTLWYFDTWGTDNYEIKVAQVIKETEKTFVVVTNGCYNHTVKKSEMDTFGFNFYLSKEQAEQGLVDYLKSEIADYETKIKCAQKGITKRKTILKERFNVEVK